MNVKIEISHLDVEVGSEPVIVSLNHDLKNLDEEIERAESCVERNQKLLSADRHQLRILLTKRRILNKVVEGMKEVDSEPLSD